MSIKSNNNFIFFLKPALPGWAGEAYNCIELNTKSNNAVAPC